jgi:hypothetical protein
MRLVGIVCCTLLIPLLPSTRETASLGVEDRLKTFTNAKWAVAMEYPSDWSVDDDGDEVTFRSDDGESIVLGRVGTDSPSEPAPGRRNQKPQCSTVTTAHDVVATVCFDPASLTRRAVLVLKTRDGVQSRLAIRTRGRDAQHLDAMVASVRRYP